MQASTQESEVKQESELKQAKILIVDDNEADSSLLKRLLERAGYQNVTELNDSRNVASLHEQERFDLILLDHNMPYLDGLEVVGLLKEIEQDSYVPVLMVTAHNDRETRIKVLAAGCKDVISKPYDRTEIINRVYNMVEVRILHNRVREQNRILSERENDLRTIVENIAEGIIVSDEQGYIKTFNEAAERIFGHGIDDVAGRHMRSLLAPLNSECKENVCGEFFHPNLQEAMLGKAYECTGVRKNGELFPLSMMVTRAVQHRQPVFVAICRDITEEKRAAEVEKAAKDLLEERVKERTEKLIKINDQLLKEIQNREQTERELAAARDQAIEASRLKSEFLANVSHEIRTPLNGMLGMLSILSESGLRDELDDYVRTAYRSGGILLNLINDLLDFSKVEAGKIELEHIPYDLHAIVKDLQQLFYEQTANKGLDLDKSIDDEIPQVIAGDPWRLRQILINLIGNAVKFTEKGTVRLAVKLEHAGAAHYALRFEICDTGVGIAKEDLSRIFESFTQADGSTTRRFGGTGLGLTISKKLVELMGGKIGVESELGKGSTFWFSIPQGKVSQAQKQALFDNARGQLHRPAQVAVLGRNSQEIKSSAESASIGERQLRVLLVEDDAVNQKVATKMLQKMQCDVDIRGNGALAIDAVKSEPYDLIFMDCFMPEVDGFEAARLIRAFEEQNPQRKRTPIIAMTANVRKQDQDRCYAAGMDDFVAKPVSMDALRQVISRWQTESASP